MRSHSRKEEREKGPRRRWGGIEREREREREREPWRERGKREKAREREHRGGCEKGRIPIKIQSKHLACGAFS